MWIGDVQEELEIDDEGDDQMNRLFTFEVAKTYEQEENVVSRPGVNVRGFLFMSDKVKTKVGRPINVVPWTHCCGGTANQPCANVPLWREKASGPHLYTHPPGEESSEGQQGGQPNSAPGLSVCYFSSVFYNEAHIIKI